MLLLFTVTIGLKTLIMRFREPVPLAPNVPMISEIRVLSLVPVVRVVGSVPVVKVVPVLRPSAAPSTQNFPQFLRKPILTHWTRTPDSRL